MHAYSFKSRKNITLFEITKLKDLRVEDYHVLTILRKIGAGSSVLWFWFFFYITNTSISWGH
jgi:hypothetical protein